MATYGIDPEAPLADGDDDEERSVVVSDTDIPLSQASLHSIQATINPLQECSDFGIQLYKEAVQAVYQLMQNDGLA